MNITIRQSTQADLAAILKLYQQPSMDDGKAIDIQRAERIYQRLSHYPFYEFYVACLEDSSIVGVFGLLIMDNLGHQGSPAAVVEGVCVDELYRNQGIGKQMMASAVEISREYGCYKLALTSNSKRKKAHQFYQGLGFEQHGISFHLSLKPQ